jgi:hypothetical protein
MAPLDDLGTRLVWVACFTTLTPNARGNSPRYPLDRRLDAPQRRSGNYGEDKNLAPAENRNPAAKPVARRCTDWAICAPVLIGIIIVTCIPIARQRIGKHIPGRANQRKNRTSIARQQISKHAFLTIEAVFRGARPKWLQGTVEKYRRRADRSSD